MNRVYAQQARRFMDRIVGYMISPLLCIKILRDLSAGRVQSVAVRIIIERENIIKNFISKEYWKLNVSLCIKDYKKIKMNVTYCNNKIFDAINKNELNSAIKTIKKSSCIVESYKEKKFVK